MALINCPECGKKVSSFAVACPNCGYPRPANSIPVDIERRLEDEAYEALIRKAAISEDYGDRLDVVFDEHTPIDVLEVLTGDEGEFIREHAKEELERRRKQEAEYAEAETEPKPKTIRECRTLREAKDLIREKKEEDFLRRLKHR